MKALASLLVFAGVAYLIYSYSLKKMPTTDVGTAPTQAISLTGVRGDLLQIAQSERSFLALNDHCANIDELISSNSITMRQPERDGYTPHSTVAPPATSKPPHATPPRRQTPPSATPP